MVDVARQRAQSQPDDVAYTFLSDGETAEERLSYAEVDRRARAIAARLQAECAQGDRVLLCHPPGLEYVSASFGCLYAGVLAVPAYPPRPGRSREAVLAIVADARPRVALAPVSLAPLLQACLDPTAVRWIASDTIPGEEATAWRSPSLDDAALAFLQYTSGSTRAPRGVCVGHAGLVHNLASIREAFRHDAESRGVIWLPPHHDMGLIGGILEPLFAGFPVVLMSPASFLQRPLRWLQAISRYRASTSGGPNFAYDLCVDRVSAEQRAGLDLGCWRVAFNGAEPVRAETLERFSAAFAATGFRRSAFYPCYGLAEATLMVSGRFEDENGSNAAVSCGRPGRDLRVEIVDPDTRRLAATGQLGEIWVSGPSVASGYWNRPEETEACFGARLADGGEDRFLRTGDLGFVAAGELHVAGRLKDVVIIDGRNHHAEDLEWTAARSHPALQAQGAAAFGIEVAGVERLAILHEVAPRARAEELDAVLVAIRSAVAADHSVRVETVALLRPGGLPKTSSGKVRRSLCRERFLSGQLQVVRESRLSAAGDRSGAGRA